MLSQVVLTAVLLSTVRAFTPASTTGTDALAAAGLKNLIAYEKSSQNSSSCSVSTARVRKEWSALKDSEKKDYIDAVLCLQSKPSISGDLVPGARSRYDDFVAAHINQTLTIHETVSRLSKPSDIVLTVIRATSFHGTATTSGPTRQPYEMNADIRAINLTSTGEDTLTIYSMHPSSTTATSPSAAMELTNRSMALAYPQTSIQSLSFHLETVPAASLAVPSKIWSSISAQSLQACSMSLQIHRLMASVTILDA